MAKRKSNMSSRERMLAVIERQGPDHVPFSPYLCQGPWHPEPFCWGNQIERAQRMLELGLDPTIDIWLPYPEPGAEVEIRTCRDTSGPEVLLTKGYHTPAGVLRQVVRETPGWCDARRTPWNPTTFGTERCDNYNMQLIDYWNVPRRTEPWVKGAEDLEKLKYVIQPPRGHLLDEWRMDAQRVMEVARKLDVVTQARRTIVGDAFLWFCDHTAWNLWMFDEPELVREFIGIFQKWAMELTALALDLGVDIVQRRGWYESPDFYGPKFWKEYLSPGIQEETELVHRAGKRHCYLLPSGQGTYASFLKEMDVDVLLGIDPPLLYGEIKDPNYSYGDTSQLQGSNLKMLFDQLGDRKSFWGGVNAEGVLDSEDPALIDKSVKDAVEGLGGNGGLILGAWVLQETTPKSIDLMIEAWKKYRTMYSK